MKTENLISMLVFGPRAPSRSAVVKRLGSSVIFSLAAVLFTLLFVLPGGVNAAALAARLSMPLFWAKLALPLSMSIAAMIVAARLSRPGVRVGRAWTALGVPIALVWVAALAALAFSPPGLRGAMILGHTWRTCSLHIAVLSIPALVALQLAMRGLAPTRPALAGAAAGVLAGAIGALAYCLRCPEMAVPFWALWYFVGMSLPALVGALVGPRTLRW
ncbi:DUF1109 domain-containing protein [Caballeronia grimmiae]|uniref:Anti-sigma F factor n=1 Tax=Caballeronia grimmiae TaxID=1071679 RepID=A0A069NEX1_9BURK|nr:DUF1109 domain-containing protein [Caballeronia grimmiae]KDR26229.1 hypothetical protein BG57_26840 [Caballeronia grimmiae]GGD70211.1 hypothetical protein GCM10010985_25880 [Caballeronia grimmiae]